MATHRPYRASFGLDAAVDELRTHPEKYDANVVSAFIELNEAGCVTV
jgi:HD-GYP domain-containing protein (c-di-GMP phosphodiesterase class II)